jgi:cytochrome c oxidase subunit II
VIQLAATDVIHNFSLPNFRVKQDAIPGTITRLWFQAKATGTFEIACAQHCGVNHYKMKGLLMVLTPEAYALWAQEASRLSAESYDPADQAAQWGWSWERRRQP